MCEAEEVEAIGAGYQGTGVGGFESFPGFYATSLIPRTDEA